MRARRLEQVQAKKEEVRRKLRERRVPSSPFGRVAGFAQLGASLVYGTVADQVRGCPFFPMWCSELRSLLHPRRLMLCCKCNFCCCELLTPPGMDSSLQSAQTALKYKVLEVVFRSVPASTAQDNPYWHVDTSRIVSPASRADFPSLAQVSSYFGGEERRGGGGNAYLTERNAERLADALCRMRGAALKLGQMLSIQDENVLPPQVSLYAAWRCGTRVAVKRSSPMLDFCRKDNGGLEHLGWRREGEAVGFHPHRGVGVREFP